MTETLVELSAKLQQANLLLPEVRDVWRRRIATARDNATTAPPELLGYLDTAANMIGSIAHMGTEQADEVGSMVVRLVRLAADIDTVSQARAMTKQPAQPMQSADATDATTINNMALGDVMVQLGLLTEDQVDQALKKAVSSSRRFEQVLVDEGLVTREDVVRSSRLQHHLLAASVKQNDEARPSQPHPTRAIQNLLFGEILVQMRRITRADLDQGLARQKETGERIGEALVGLGLIGWDDVNEAVKVQHQNGVKFESASDTIIRLDD